MKRLREKLEGAAGDRTKLETKRHAITAEIDTLATREKALKEELRTASH